MIHLKWEAVLLNEKDLLTTPVFLSACSPTSRQAWKVAKISEMLYTYKLIRVWLWEFLYGNNVLFRGSQISEDGENPLFGITFTDGLEQTRRYTRHRQVPFLKIILTKLSGEKLKYVELIK